MQAVIPQETCTGSGTITDLCRQSYYKNLYRQWYHNRLKQAVIPQETCTGSDTTTDLCRPSYHNKLLKAVIPQQTYAGSHTTKTYAGSDTTLNTLEVGKSLVLLSCLDVNAVIVKHSSRSEVKKGARCFGTCCSRLESMIATLLNYRRCLAEAQR
jgi:hypothetical protein